MTATKLPVLEGDPPPDEAPGAEREGAIRTRVLAALGRPGQPFRVAVVPLWGDHFRVNVVTGAGPGAARIPHSYFVSADARGNILASAPTIRREYPTSP